MKVYRVSDREGDIEQAVRAAMAEMDRDDPLGREPCVLELPAGEWPGRSPIFVSRDHLTIRWAGPDRN